MSSSAGDFGFPNRFLVSCSLRRVAANGQKPEADGTMPERTTVNEQKLAVESGLKAAEVASPGSHQRDLKHFDDRRTNMNPIPSSFLLLALLAAPATLPAQSETARTHVTEHSERARDNVIKQVRHELVMLPFYSVFDNLAFRVDGTTVTLLGDVSRPTLKDDAERVVNNIEGVERVDNQIEVLPLSPNDDRIRLALYRAIYSQTGLDRYAIMAVPSIHIIVKNGDVKLEGVVASQFDKNLANVTANSVAGVFSVTNNLRLEQ